MMRDDVKVRILQVGLGSYGAFLLGHMMRPPSGAAVEVVGIVDPSPADENGALSHAREADVPVFPSLEAFFKLRTADLAVLASPIHLHREHVETCTAYGLNVMCEKPLAATVQDGLRMQAAAARTGRFVDVGFQWSHSETIQKLKRDIMTGAFGRPIRLRAICLWPRVEAYYTRNDWSGRLQHPSGPWVLDSPVANAAAHFLHNCFYVLGSARETSLRPESLQAETYRVKAIESYDTAGLRCRSPEGAEILFYASHAVEKELSPAFDFAFERADVSFHGSGGRGTVIARFHDGQMRDYGNPWGDPERKLWDSVRCTAEGSPPPCPIEAALPHLACANATHDSREIVDLPAALNRTAALALPHNTGACVYAEGLLEGLKQCYAASCLPSELGTLTWARPGREIHLGDYRWFPGGTPPAQP